MKVIFLSDVPRVGRKHEIKEVNDGYAINFLLPKGLVKVATSSAIKELEERKKGMIIERELEEKLLLKNLEELKNKTVTFEAKANDKGHLFSAIHVKEILEAMKREHRIELKEELISLSKPIKEVGEFDIPVEINKKQSSFKLVVKAI